MWSIFKMNWIHDLKDFKIELDIVLTGHKDFKYLVGKKQTKLCY